MVVILQLFYPDEAFKIFSSDSAVVHAADNAVDWLAGQGFTNMALDVCNECDLCRIAEGICNSRRLSLSSLHWPGTPGAHGKLHELLRRVKARLAARGLHPPISTSYLGGATVRSNELQYMDYVRLEGSSQLKATSGPARTACLCPCAASLPSAHTANGAWRRRGETAPCIAPHICPCVHHVRVCVRLR